MAIKKSEKLAPKVLNDSSKSATSVDAPKKKPAARSSDLKQYCFQGAADLAPLSKLNPGKKR